MGKARILRRKALATKDYSNYVNFVSEIGKIFKSGNLKEREEAADVLKDPKLLEHGLKLKREPKMAFSPRASTATRPVPIPNSI